MTLVKVANSAVLTVMGESLHDFGLSRSVGFLEATKGGRGYVKRETRETRDVSA